MTAPTDFHRKVVIAKVLHDRNPGRTLPDYAADAQAILDALDEPAELHEAPATLLSVEQQIRLGVLGYLVDGGTPLEYDVDDPAEVARMLAPVADPLVAWVATGAVPAEPAPPLPADQDTTTTTNATIACQQRLYEDRPRAATPSR